jgi:hypothetical protein
MVGSEERMAIKNQKIRSEFDPVDLSFQVGSEERMVIKKQKIESEFDSVDLSFHG